MLSFSPPSNAGEALMPFLVIVGLQWLFQMNSDGTGYLAQRSMACPTDREARIAGLVFTWLQIFLRSLFWLAIAIGLLVLYPFSPEEMNGDGFTAAREALFVTGIDELLPPGFRGLMLVGLLAALASTVDTHLNWGASYWSNDVYGGVVAPKLLKRKPKDKAGTGGATVQRADSADRHGHHGQSGLDPDRLVHLAAVRGRHGVGAGAALVVGADQPVFRTDGHGGVADHGAAAAVFPWD